MSGPAAVPVAAAARRRITPPDWHGLRSDRRVLSAGLALVALVAAGVFVVVHSATKTVTGSITVEGRYSYGVDDPGGSCGAGSGYDDIREGEQAVLADGEGRTLATASLGEGTSAGGDCIFEMTFEDVPRADFYTVTMGSSFRGDIRYSYADMVDKDWGIQLSLGGDS